jgi:hypothetical protein
MKTSNHHPGPWRVATNRRLGDMARIVADDDYTIGYALIADRNREALPEDEANARLMAAAPALFEALLDCISIERKSASREYLRRRIVQINTIVAEAMRHIQPALREN